MPSPPFRKTPGHFRHFYRVFFFSRACFTASLVLFVSLSRDAPRNTYNAVSNSSFAAEQNRDDNNSAAAEIPGQMFA